MAENPFLFKQKITNPKYFIGRRTELAQITARLNGTRPQGTALMGEAQIGKSSLLYYLAHPRPNESLRSGPGQKIIYLDVSTCETPEQFRETLFRRLLSSSDKVEIDQDESFSWQNLQKSVKRLPFYPIICLDEIEFWLANHEAGFDEDFFNILHQWSEDRQITWLTASTSPLLDVAHSYNLTSSFFPGLTPLLLGPFKEQEIDRLLALAENTPYAFTIAEQTSLRHLAGEHPYHLQVVAWRLWEAKKNNQSVSEKELFRFLCEQPDPPKPCAGTSQSSTSAPSGSFWLKEIALFVLGLALFIFSFPINRQNTNILFKQLNILLGPTFEVWGMWIFIGPLGLVLILILIAIWQWKYLVKLGNKFIEWLS